MFPGTNFQPPHHYYEIGATTVPESSGGDVNYNAQSPVPSGITKLHWRKDYTTGGSWTASSFPGYEIPDGYGSDGYNDYIDNCLTNKIAKDLNLGEGNALYNGGHSNPNLNIGPGTYVIKIPEDVAMGSKELALVAGTQLWSPGSAIPTGNFPPGSTIIIHNYGIIAGAGGPGGRGGGVFVASTPNNDALGGGGGGGAGLQDWDLPFAVHEQGDNSGDYPLDADKSSGGPNPDRSFAGSGGTPSLQITIFNGNEAANGAFGSGNLVASATASGGAGSTADGITQAGTPTASEITATLGSIGGACFHSTTVSQTFWIYNQSTGKIYGGAGGGGGGGGIANAEGDGGDGGVPGEAGTAGQAAGGGGGGAAAGTAGRVFEHNGLFDAAGATQTKFIIKQNDGTIKGNEGDNSAFGVGTEH